MTIPAPSSHPQGDTHEEPPADGALQALAALYRQHHETRQCINAFSALPEAVQTAHYYRESTLDGSLASMEKAILGYSAHVALLQRVEAYFRDEALAERLAGEMHALLAKVAGVSADKEASDD